MRMRITDEWIESQMQNRKPILYKDTHVIYSRILWLFHCTLKSDCVDILNFIVLILVLHLFYLSVFYAHISHFTCRLEIGEVLTQKIKEQQAIVQIPNKNKMWVKNCLNKVHYK